MPTNIRPVIIEIIVRFQCVGLSQEMLRISGLSQDVI